MRPLLKLKHAVVATAALFVVACVTDPMDISDRNMAKEAIENPDHAIIRSLELSTEDIVEMDDRYIVEGDIVVSKEYVEELRNEPKTRQAYYYRDIPRDVVRDINVHIDPALEDGSPNSWYKAAVAALNIWNSVPNCEIGFNVNTSPYPRRVIVRRNAAAGIAWAELPKSQCPGEYVEIGNQANSYDLEQKTFVMVHEFGHILRFMHSNYKTNDADASSRKDTKDIAGTPDGEILSVMYSHSGGRDWSIYGFTAGDLAAAQALYGTPIWSQQITGPAFCPVYNPPTYTLNLGTNLTNLNVSWYANNVLKQNGTSLNFTPASLPAGQVTLKAVVNYGGVNYEANKVITVLDTAISGPNYTPLNTNVTYSVPASGVTFNGWTVSPSSYTVTGGTTGLNLNVKFTAGTIYTITARFTLPGNVSHSVTRTIDLRPPSITSVTPSRSSVAPGAMVTFTAAGTNLDSAPIQWEIVSGCTGIPGNGKSFLISTNPGPTYATVRCRVLQTNGSYSAWVTGRAFIDNNLPWLAP